MSDEDEPVSEEAELVRDTDQVVSDEPAEVVSQGGPALEEEALLEGEGGEGAPALAAVEWLCVTVTPAPRAL